MKLRHVINYAGLEKFLLSIKSEDIERNWNKKENPKLMEGIAMDDIEFFKLDLSKIPKQKIINYGEPFLVDALGNDLSIVILSKKRYKLPTGRVVRSKFVTTIIDDCRKVYGTALNGYWKIPNEFITPIK